MEYLNIMKNKKELIKTIFNSIFFSAKNIVQLEKYASLKAGIISIFIVAFVLTIPADRASMTIGKWSYNFGLVLLLFAGLMALACILARAFGMKESFSTFFNTVSFNLALSLILVSTPIFIIAQFLFNMLLGYDLLSLVLFSLLPYYNFVLFGWSCETVSKIGGKRSVALAVICMTLLFMFYYLLRFITI